MTEAEGILIQLTANVICDKPTSFNELSDETLKEVYKIAKRHDMSHYIGAALSKKEIKVSDAAFQHYQNVMLSTVARMRRISYELERASEALEKAEIQFIPLKGAVVRNFYPEFWMRTSCDIDILVHEEEFEKAIEAINSDGRFTIGEMHPHSRDVSLYAAGINIELHFNIIDYKDNLDAVLKDVWEYAVPREKYKYLMGLTPEYQLFHIYAHAANHFIEGGCGIKPLIDIFLLEKSLKYNGELFGQLLERSSLTRFREGLKALSNVWFANADHSALTLSMEKYIFSGGVYGSKINSMLVRGTKRAPERYVLNRIFMPYEFISIKYPILRKHKYLTPVFEVVRWISFIFKGNYEERAEEVRTFNAVADGDKRQIDQMLKNLGLREEKK